MKALLLAALAAGPVLPSAARAQGGIETPQARENYRIKTRQDLDRLNERLSALELRSHVESSRARENLAARTAELRVQKKNVDELFSRIETGTDQQRRVARARLDIEIESLRAGIERAEGAHPAWGS
ncbi:MAG TPA: hypothetical protein VN915_15965 [Elusimicrobiota bacterium]|nr:hypothetical protein [Elusimicrobiota bacterium]